MIWVYRLGLEHAKQFLLTGQAIDAATALRIGLVSEVASRRTSCPQKVEAARAPLPRTSPRTSSRSTSS